MISRRTLLKAIATFGLGSTGFGGYAVGETFRQAVTHYTLTPPNWTPGLKLRIAIIADLHCCEPWMPASRVDSIVRQTNALGADAILLLGDYVASHRMQKFSNPVSAGAWATALSHLKAPFGVHAVLGNHDWWDDIDVQRRRAGPTRAERALEAVGIPVYENKAARFEKDGNAFWIAGLGDQWAFWPTDNEYEKFVKTGRKDYTGVDDLGGTLAQVTDNAPVLLMIHEPDIFPEIPKRVSATFAGHTHGGQVNLFGYTPIVPSKYKSRYVYGHIVEDDRSLIVSAGLGVSGFPIRFGARPEIVVVDLGSEGGF